MISVLIIRDRWTQTGSQCEDGGRDRSIYKPRNPTDWPQPPGGGREAEDRPSCTVSGRNRPCQHLGLGLLAFGTVRERTSVVLSHPVCGTWLLQSWETNVLCHVIVNTLFVTALFAVGQDWKCQDNRLNSVQWYSMQV